LIFLLKNIVNFGHMRKVFETKLEEKLPSINAKYTVSRGRMVLNRPFREAKRKLKMIFKLRYKGKVHTEKMYIVLHIETGKDIDNLEKMLIDSMEGIIYKNDRQVLEKHTYRKVSKRGSIDKIFVEVGVL